jgi:hypothetical protein
MRFVCAIQAEMSETQPLQGECFLPLLSRARSAYRHRTAHGTPSREAGARICARGARTHKLPAQSQWSLAKPCNSSRGLPTDATRQKQKKWGGCNGHNRTEDRVRGPYGGANVPIEVPRGKRSWGSLHERGARRMQCLCSRSTEPGATCRRERESSAPTHARSLARAEDLQGSKGRPPAGGANVHRSRIAACFRYWHRQAGSGAGLLRLPGSAVLRKAPRAEEGHVPEFKE